MGPEIPYPQEGTWDQRYPTPNPRKGHGPGTEPECRVGPQMNKIEQVSGHITTPIHLGVGYGGGYPIFPMMHVMYLPSYPQQNAWHLWKHYLPATSLAAVKTVAKHYPSSTTYWAILQIPRYTNYISEVTLQNYCKLFSSVVIDNLPPPYTPPLIAVVRVFTSRYYYFIKPAKNASVLCASQLPVSRALFTGSS